MNSTLSESTTQFPLFVVLSGPAGVGKDALLEKMRERGNPLHVVVTATSREKRDVVRDGVRQKERDGVDYHFYSGDEFERLIQAGELLEHAVVYGNYYGVPRAAVRKGLEQGKDTIVRTDVQGAASMRAKVPEAILVFLVPPDLETLARQLTYRNTDTPETIRKRLDAAPEEMRHVSSFDYAIINRYGKLDETARTLEAIITAEKHRVRRRPVVV